MAGVKAKQKALQALDLYARDLDEALSIHLASGADEQTVEELRRERELVRQAEVLLLAGDS